MARELVDAPSLEVLKARLHKGFSKLVYKKVSLPVAGEFRTRWCLRSILTPQHSMILSLVDEFGIQKLACIAHFAAQ